MFSAAAVEKVGTVKAFGGSTAPDGWLFCDGSAISRTTYADLFAVIGTTYGAGDGTTTFNLPYCGVTLGGAAQVTVFGNGKSMCLTDGTDGYGLVSINNSYWDGLVADKYSFGAGIATSGGVYDSAPSGARLGLSGSTTYGDSGVIGAANLTNMISSIIKY